MYLKVEWETDGEKVDIPSIVYVPRDLELTNESVCSYLSDTYGWLVTDWSIHVTK